MLPVVEKACLIRVRPFLARTMSLLLLVGAAVGAELPAPSSVGGSVRDAMLVLKSECFSCHNPEKKKGGLVLTSREALLKGGEDGPVVLDGRSGVGRLLGSLSRDADPHMPPKKQLSEAQIRTLQAWVRGGVLWNQTALLDESPIFPVRLGPLPSTYQPVNALALSKDGKQLAASRGGWISLYTVSPTNVVVSGRVEAHLDAVQSLAWSPDGRWIASGAFRRVAIWDATSHRLEREWTNGFSGPVTALEFAPNSEGVMAADGMTGQSGMLRWIPLKAGSPMTSWRAHSDTVFDLEFSRDGSQLVTAGGDRLIRVWEVATRKEIATLEGHTAQVLTAAFNSNATQVVSGGADKELKVWDIASREKIISLGRHSAGVTGVSWPGDNQVIFAVGEDGAAYRYTDLKAHNGEQSSASGQEHSLGHSTDGMLCVAANSDHTMVFVGSQDGSVRAWTQEGKLIATLSAEGPSSTFASAPLGEIKQASPTDAKHKNASRPVASKSLSDSELLRGKRVLSISASPSAIHLYPDAPHHGILISAQTDEGFDVDVTTRARFVPGPRAPFELELYGGMRAIRPGQGVLVASFEGRQVEVPVTVHGPVAAASPVTFLKDVLPVLSRAGCNGGACHAKAEGQNGFKLSVFSYDPRADYAEIVNEDRGRRVFPSVPELSLLIQKPTALVSHEGGMRFELGSEPHQLLTRWIREGMVYSRTNEAILETITAFPRERRYWKGGAQRLLVEAHYSDGSLRDVTSLAAFVSNDKEIARVDEHGNVDIGSLTGQGVIVARYMGFVSDSQVLVPADRVLPADDYVSLPRNNFIDDHAFDHFRQLGLFPSEGCSDAEFLRRAKLDAIGLLPTAEEVTGFLNDSSQDKRFRFIERVLDDPAYADYWANKWADLLRPNPDRVGVKSIFVLDQWLRDSFRANKPYDQFVREIVLAEGTNHRDGPAVVYRDRREPADLTTLFSQVFLGTRLECARCHHHPNEKWAQDDFYQLAAFFGPLKQKGAGLSPPISAGTETFYYAPGGSVKHPVTGAVMSPRPPDGPLANLPETVDPRRALADWLTTPDNPFFARAAVNRVWTVFFGRGLVEPVDDFRISNPCVNPALLAALAEDFVRHGYDLKHLMRTIMESRLYQLSAAPNETNLADTRNFSRAYRRRLAAEVLMDAVNDLTGVPDTLAAMVPGGRAVQAWSYKIDSQFLDAFGRPNSSSDCPCERDLQTSVVQSLHMMHSRGLQTKLANPQGRVHRLASGSQSASQIVNELYVATLSRRPTDEELKMAIAAFATSGATRQSATEDVLWALLNSAEFVFNH